MKVKLTQYWHSIQQCLFPEFEDEIGVVTRQHQRIMVVLDYLELERHILEPKLFSKGRPAYSRVALANAFVAKSILNLHSTLDLIERLRVDRTLFALCGFDPRKKLPCEATFSNAFSEFADLEQITRIHEVIVKEALKGDLVFHISRDSTDIPVREKVAKVKKVDKGKRKTKKLRGKQRRLFKQQTMSFEEMLADLPREVGSATKRNHSWKGYKLHLDISDGGIPISAILTSPHLHDSQAAIPLEEMTSRRVKSLYTLMDQAYDAAEIRSYIASKNKIAIIDPHKRAGTDPVLDPASQTRYKERNTAERVNGWIKDSYGMRRIQVRGPRKVMGHIMFGLLSLTALRLIATA